MATISVGMDASSVISSATSMVNSFGSISASVRDATLESARYNAAGTLMSGTIRGIDTDGRAFTATLRNLGPGVAITGVRFQELNRNLGDSRAKFQELSKAVNEISSMFQRFVGFKALNALTEGLKEGFNAAKDFQVQISLIRTISQDNQLSFGTWSKNLKEVSDNLGTGLAETSKAAYDAISNQVAKGRDVFPFLKDAGDLARVTGGTIDQAGNLMASAMNSYGLSVSQTKEINALFFATIDEGRVNMGEMANTFGRVAILAKGLDIPINELASSIAFLTQKGVTTDDSFTFMKNVFIQLQKPSEQLSAFFKSIGVSSGEAAIKTYGFMGILRKIKDEVGSGNVEVAKLFPEIRAQQPIQAALNDYANYDRITQKFGDTAKLLDTYQKAIDIRAESPADYINKEFNKLKNTLTVDIGQKLITLAKETLQGFSQITKVFTGSDSLSSGLNLAIVLFRDLTIGIIAFRTASALAAGAIAATGAATNAAGAGATRAAVSFKLLNMTLSASIIGLAAALAAVVITKAAFSNDLLSGPSVFEGWSEDLKKLREDTIKTNAVKVKSPFEKTQETNNKTFDTTLKGLANMVVEAEGSLGKLKALGKSQEETFKNAFQTYTDALKNNVSELGKKVTEAEGIIKNSRKGIVDFKDSLNQMVDSYRLENLTGGAKLDFIDKRTQELIRRATAGYKSGNKDQIAEADKLSMEAAKNIAERAKAADQVFKQQRQAYEAANPTAYKYTDQDYKNVAIERSIGLEKELNNLNSLRVKLVGDVISAKEKEIVTTNKQIAIEKRKQRDVEDAFKKFNEFSTTDAGGGIKSEYKDKVSGRVDVKKASADFEKIADDLRTKVGKTGDFAARVQVETLIANMRKQKIKELAATEYAESVKLVQQRTGQAKKESDERMASNKKVQADAIAAQNGLLQKALEVIPDVKKIADAGTAYKETELFGLKATDFPLIGKPLKGAKGIRADKTEYNENKQRMDDYRAAAEKLRETLKKTKDEQVEVDGVLQNRPENVAEVIKAANNLKTKQRAAFQPLTGPEYERAVVPGSESGQTFGETDKLLDQLVRGLIEKTGIIQQNPERQKLNQGKFEAEVEPNLKSLQGLSPASFKDLDIATKQASSGLATASTSAYQLSQAVDNLRFSFNTRFAKEGEPLPTAPKDSFVPSYDGAGGAKPYSGSTIIPRAYGGWIGRPSSSIGPDKHHVLAGDGEFMVNAESASMFPDTLGAINKARRGVTPTVLGGNVSTHNVGDIYITVNEAKDGQGTSRQVWSKLRREFRRGSIS